MSITAGKHRNGSVRRTGREREGSRVGAASPVPQQIRERAYEIFLARCQAGSEGDALSDWLQAERELTVPAGPTGDRERYARRRGETLLHDPE